MRLSFGEGGLKRRSKGGFFSTDNTLSVYVPPVYVKGTRVPQGPWEEPGPLCYRPYNGKTLNISGPLYVSMSHVSTVKLPLNSEV